MSMENDDLERIVEEAALEHRGDSFSEASLWWLGEGFWRSATPFFGRSFSSTRTGHPGAVLSSPRRHDQVAVMFTVGRSPKPGSFPRNDEVFVELRLIGHPEKLTRFGGYDGFIGMLPVDALLDAGGYMEGPDSYTSFWINPNKELEELDEDAFAVLDRWLKNILGIS